MAPASGMSPSQTSSAPRGLPTPLANVCSKEPNESCNRRCDSTSPSGYQAQCCQNPNAFEINISQASAPTSDQVAVLSTNLKLPGNADKVPSGGSSSNTPKYGCCSSSVQQPSVGIDNTNTCYREKGDLNSPGKTNPGSCASERAADSDLPPTEPTLCYTSVKYSETREQASKPGRCCNAMESRIGSSIEVDDCCSGDLKSSRIPEQPSKAHQEPLGFVCLGTPKNTDSRIEAETPREFEDCCNDSSGPCCTEACAEAHARFIFDLEEAGASDSSASRESSADRLQSAFDKYAAMIQKAICLCRNLSTSDAVRCCARTRPAHTPVEKEDSCKTASADSHLAPRPISQVGDVGCEDACCKTKLLTSTVKESLASCQDSCCSVQTADWANRRLKTIGDESCSKPQLAASEPSKTTSRTVRNVDTEAATDYEDVVVAVQGMTCTGCETKLSRSLASISGVSCPRVVFVSGRAEFKVDTSQISAEAVVSQAQILTGFGISRVRQDLMSLDLLSVDGQFPTIEALPRGTVEVKKLDGRYFRIFYNPYELSAREIVKSIKPTACLAPANVQGNTGDKGHLLSLALKTASSIALTIPVCVFAWANISLTRETKAIASLPLATGVQVIAVLEFYWNAIRSVMKSRTIELDMLVVISVTAAYSYSVVACGFLLGGRPLRVEGFFETSTLLVSLVLLGRLIAGYARSQAVASVSMRSLQTSTVTLLLSDGSEKEIDTRLLYFGDAFSIPAHSRIPTDGIVLTNESEVYESVVTGESIPVKKSPGSRIIAGTINGSGKLTATVDRLPGQNTITDIAKVVEAAQASKPKVQELADKLASYFIPVVLTIALVVFVVWAPISLRIRGLSGGDAIVDAITYCVAVLAVSCPCALGLAVPMVVVITSGIAARHGVIIKTASSTEKAWSITDVVFDKTGTLTLPELTVVQEEFLTPIRELSLQVILGLAIASDHPVSRAVASHLKAKSIIPAKIADHQSLPGRGLMGKFLSTTVRAGDPQWLGVGDHPLVQRIQADGLTLFCITYNEQLLAAFALESTVRPEAVTVLGQLQSRGLRTHILSGDHEASVSDVGRLLKIDNIRSRQSPKDKCNYIDDLIAKQSRCVLFCGDGTNDAAAVARANIGVSMGTTSDITGSAADVVLLGDLHGVVKLLDLSKAAYCRIIFNFAWAGVYNLFAILLASGAFVTFRLPPAYAGVGELVSVLPVVLVAATMYLGS